MKKHIANILSSIRIVLAFILLFFRKMSPAFLHIYIIAAVTDLIDGPIARRTHSESILGAKLDTAGDIATYGAMLKIGIATKALSVETFLWFCIPFAFLVLSALISLVRFRVFAFIHTFLAKTLGAGLFFLPFFFSNPSKLHSYLIFVWILAFITAIEMILIQFFSDSANPDAKHLYGVLRKAEE